MAVLTESIAVDLIILTISILLVVRTWLNRRYNYWQDRAVPFAKPVFGFGSFKNNLLGKTGTAEILDDIYQEFKQERLAGYFEFHVPKLLIRDPELVSKILVKDFAHFHDRGVIPPDIETEPLTNNIANLEGHQWRQLRYKLSPVFTSGKLKGMFEQIYNCGEDLLEELNKYVKSKEPIEARDVMSIFTNDVIASCAFGLQFKLSSPQGEPFKKMVLASFPRSRFNNIAFILRAVNQSLSRFLNIRVFSKQVTDYFINLAKETMKYREENNVKRNDFFEMLLNLKRMDDNIGNNTAQNDEEDNEDDALINQIKYSSVYNGSVKNTKIMTDGCFAASTFIFLVAGSEVSSSLSFLLYCLAKNPDVQTKLQQEVDSVLKKHGSFNYLSVKEMVYMDQVIQESLRMFPIAPFLARVCTIPYKVPDSNLTIEKGVFVSIPVRSMHRDPRNFPEPDVFKPERFVDNNFKPSSTYLPFGDGPRICIAMRFAILEMKICVARVMSQYTLRMHEKTSDPLKLDPHTLFTRSYDGIWLTVHNRDNKMSK